MFRFSLALLLFLLTATAGAQPWRTNPWPGALQSVAGKAERSGLSLDEAAEQVQRETGGRVLSATTVSRKGRTVHRIKVLTPKKKVLIREIPAR